MNRGPNNLPLAVTTVRFLPNNQAPAELLRAPIFYLTQNNGRVVPGESARAFLFKKCRSNPNGCFVIGTAPALGQAASNTKGALRMALAPTPTELACPPDPPDDIPVPPGCERNARHAIAIGDLCLRLRAEPNATAPPGAVITYQLAIHNSGRSHISRAQISLPFAPPLQELLDVVFTRPDAWVSSIGAGVVYLQFDSLGPDDTITATLRLRIAPTAASNTILYSRATLPWNSTLVHSNSVSLTIASVPSTNAVVPLRIEPIIGSPTTMFAVAFSGFSSYERVGIWLHSSDDRIFPLEGARADALGKIAVHIPAAALPVGRAMLVASGQCNQVTAAGTITKMAE